MERVQVVERGLAEPRGKGIARIAAVLQLELDSMPARFGHVPARPPESFEWAQSTRERLIATLAGSKRISVAYLDRPAQRPSGDLAFAVHGRSHSMVAVIDGTGTGAQAMVSAMTCAGAILGLDRTTKDVVWPDELIAAAHAAGEVIGERILAAMFIVVVDPRNSAMTWARSGFPAPLLRGGGRARHLRGERMGGVESGRVLLSDDWLLLVGTDGIAHLPGRGDNVLWETRDVRQLVSLAEKPGDLTDALAQKFDRRSPKPEDDAFAVALAGR